MSDLKVKDNPEVDDFYKLAELIMVGCKEDIINIKEVKEAFEEVYLKGYKDAQDELLKQIKES